VRSSRTSPRTGVRGHPAVAVWHDRRVSEWGRATFGDPCAECGFDWDVATSELRTLVSGLPARLEVRLSGTSGEERHPSLGWSVTGYVAHVGDNLRIWAERLTQVTRGGVRVVADYDENALARARGYDALGLAGVLWTLERSARDWVAAVELAPADLTLDHTERGVIGLDDVVKTSGHDALHHEWDIDRSLTV
jgi:hypothetical protein